MPIIAPIPCDKRYLMIEALHTTDDKLHLRRLNAILLLEQSYKVSHVAKMLYCARSSVVRWINLFTVGGMEALRSLTPGRERRWSRERICGLVSDLLDFSPGDFGYQRSRWSSELFSIMINDMMSVFIHPGTLRVGYLGWILSGAGPHPHCVYPIQTEQKNGRYSGSAG